MDRVLGCSDTATRFSFVVFHCSKRNVATRFSLMKIEFTLLENTTGLSFTKSNNFAAGRAYRIFIDEDLHCVVRRSEDDHTGWNRGISYSYKIDNLRAESLS